MSQPKNEIVRTHLWVSGRVQGVGFRAFVADAATALGLVGWVRNVGWNEVETLAQGPKPDVERFVQMVQRGPAVARVDQARLEWEIPGDEFS
jgi:acylphosphatase